MLRRCFVCCLVLMGWIAVPARADDWAQFRRDAQRTAASRDPVSLPLAHLWTIESRLRDGHTPLYNAAVWHGRAYFVAGEDRTRYLGCADAATGVVLWRQPLLADRLAFPIADIAGPAVSESGVVYVYDWVTDGRTRNQRAGKKVDTFEYYRTDTKEVISTARIPQGGTWLPSFCIRTFHAVTGDPGPAFLLSTMGANGVLPRLQLLHAGLADQAVIPVPPTASGCPP